jgi:hypothetical protein
VSRETSILDRSEILQILEGWGIMRDAGRWDRLRDTFAPDAVMHTSNWSGPAAEFIDNASKAPAGNGLSQHIYGGGSVDIFGHKALAESRMLVMSRKSVRGIAVDLTGFVRMFDRFVRTTAGWRILERFPLYERDRLDLVNAADELTVDLAPFASYPAGLRHVAFVQRANGRDVPARTLEMSGDGFTAFYAQWQVWLTT